MDPNIALARIREILNEDIDSGTPDDRLEDLSTLVEGLDQWLSYGGFLPDAWNVHRTTTYIAKV